MLSLGSMSVPSESGAPSVLAHDVRVIVQYMMSTIIRIWKNATSSFGSPRFISLGFAEARSAQQQPEFASVFPAVFVPSSSPSSLSPSSSVAFGCSLSGAVSFTSDVRISSIDGWAPSSACDAAWNARATAECPPVCDEVGHNSWFLQKKKGKWHNGILWDKQSESL